MQPIPETLEAVGELDPLLFEGDILDQLTTTARRARQVAPGLVGVSIGVREHGITFTLVATDEKVAALDAVQYVSSGPCVDAIDLGFGIATPDGLLNECRWQDFARASAVAGVQSTLTLPVLRQGEVVATVNLYGRASDTFTGKHRVLADTFGAWAPAAVSNADLTFSTRVAAQHAPTQLRETAIVDTAAGILASQRNVSVDDALAQLQDAARRGDVSAYALARIVVGLDRDE